MKLYTTIILLTLLIFSCSQNSNSVDIRDVSIDLVKNIKSNKTEKVKKLFYSNDHLKSSGDVDNLLNKYFELLKNSEIDTKENIIIDTTFIKFDNEFLPADTIEMFSCNVPMGINLPSPIPEYFMSLIFIKKNNEFKVIGLDLKTTKLNSGESNITLVDQININKNDINQIDLIYEGGHKNPLIFKKFSISKEELFNYETTLDSVLMIINSSKIVKSQKEFESKRFVGDAELEIIRLKLNNGFNWTIFNLVSEELEHKENFLGSLELRHYQILNSAGTYWVKSEMETEIKGIMNRLCHSGKNIRTEIKKSIKLEK